MKKQSGFTLIELMVVMAIIAILATAGLSAYTGYIKKARDTVRISDLSAINTIVLAQMSSTGLAPSDVANLKIAMSASNNSKILKDPLTKATTIISTCLGGSDATTETTDNPCVYMYKTCENNTGYNIAARFESTANKSVYLSDNAGDTGVATNIGGGYLYEVGTCTTTPTYVVTGGAGDDILDND